MFPCAKDSEKQNKDWSSSSWQHHDSQPPLWLHCDYMMSYESYRFIRVILQSLNNQICSRWVGSTDNASYLLLVGLSYGDDDDNDLW